jgi:hypothetical protein
VGMLVYDSLYAWCRDAAETRWAPTPRRPPRRCARFFSTG